MTQSTTTDNEINREARVQLFSSLCLVHLNDVKKAVIRICLKGRFLSIFWELVSLAYVPKEVFRNHVSTLFRGRLTQPYNTAWIILVIRGVVFPLILCSIKCSFSMSQAILRGLQGWCHVFERICLVMKWSGMFFIPYPESGDRIKGEIAIIFIITFLQ